MEDSRGGRMWLCHPSEHLELCWQTPALTSTVPSSSPPLSLVNRPNAERAVGLFGYLVMTSIIFRATEVRNMEAAISAMWCSILLKIISILLPIWKGGRIDRRPFAVRGSSLFSLSFHQPPLAPLLNPASQHTEPLNPLLFLQANALFCFLDIRGLGLVNHRLVNSEIDAVFNFRILGRRGYGDVIFRNRAKGQCSNLSIRNRTWSAKITTYSVIMFFSFFFISICRFGPRILFLLDTNKSDASPSTSFEWYSCRLSIPKE